MAFIQSFGAAETVTGSCHFLQIENGPNILIDCGYFQGPEESRNSEAFGFNPKNVDILLITHGHLDHVGRIPKLVKEGFNGRIIALRETMEIAQIVLSDSAKIAESDYEMAVKRAEKNQSDKIIPLPLYTLDDVHAVFELITQYVSYNKPIKLVPGIKATFRNAGHILGSATIQLELDGAFTQNKQTKKLVFSGDLGSSKSLLMPPISYVKQADALYIESTYGDQNHRPLKESVNEFKSIIIDTLKRKGNVIIPSFAVARSQEILLLLKQMYLNHELPKCNIYLDSPMAIKATQIYTHYHAELNDSAQHWLQREGSQFDFPSLRYSLKGNDEYQIDQQPSGCIIIAGSGMCSGGRILHHLKQRLSNPLNSVMFVGYQVEGTLGRQLLDGAESINLDRENIEVNAQIHRVSGFSAHADQADLLGWLSTFEKLGQIYLIHGDPAKQRVLQQAIKTQFNLSAHIVQHGEKTTI